MKAWLHQCPGEIPKGMGSPCEMAKYELDNTFPETEWTICVVPEMKDGYRIDQDDGRWVLSGGETGVLYGAYAMIRKYYSGQQVPVQMESLPRYGLRMINCWDNADGTVERGYSGRSLFFENGQFAYDPDRMRELGRLLASVGLNVLCINNVNVHDPAQLLLED